MKKTNSTAFAIGMFLPQEKAQQGIQVWVDTNWTLHPAKTIRWCQQKKKNKNLASYLEYIMVVGKYIIPCFLSFILMLSKIVWCTYIYHHDTRLFSPCCPTFHQLLLICEVISVGLANLIYDFTVLKLTVIRQKGESPNGCFKKTKHGFWIFGKFDLPCFLEALFLRSTFLPYYRGNA